MATTAVDRNGNTSTEAERHFTDQAADFAASIGSSIRTPSLSSMNESFRAKLGLDHVARRTLGICLLLVTVFLWTLSNFLASFIFSDHTYDKPFFLVYINTSAFAIALIPRFVKYLNHNGIRGLRGDVLRMWNDYKHGSIHSKTEVDDESDPSAGERLLVNDDGSLISKDKAEEKLNFPDTLKLSLEFCMLWFLANYFASACLEYTSVASVTILSSTSSVWTLIFCAIFRVESFSLRKLVGVLSSLVGVILISSLDLSGDANDDTGSFPDKTTTQIAIGDSMAFFSAIVYGVYVTVMKRRVGNEDRVDMRLFFGLVGVLNLMLLWPLFFILHWTNIEPFEMPPTGRIWAIIVINSTASFIGDISWACAMLLTTPLVVTVGLSLMIPLSLIGEMIQYGKYSSFVYWVGAVIVFTSFVFINNESKEDTNGVGERRGSVAV